MLPSRLDAVLARVERFAIPATLSMISGRPLLERRDGLRRCRDEIEEYCRRKSSPYLGPAVRGGGTVATILGGMESAAQYLGSTPLLSDPLMGPAIGAAGLASLIASGLFQRRARRHARRAHSALAAISDELERIEDEIDARLLDHRGR